MKKKWIVTVCVWCVLITVGFAQNIGIQAMTNLSALPTLPEGGRVFQVSSHDRSGGNSKDGFDGSYSELFKEDECSVLFEECGFGCVERVWMTKITETNRICFFLDGEASPKIDLSLGEFFSGTNSGFLSPLVGDNLTSSGGYYSYVPVTYTNGCRITLNEKPFFYQITARRLSSTDAISTWEPEQDLSAVLGLWTNCGVQPNVGDGRTTTTGSLSVNAGVTGLLFSTSGAGGITAIRLVPGEAGSYCLTNVWLNMCWDGAPVSQVQVPLGDFFGCRFEEAEVNSLMIGMRTNDPWYCFFPMPFWTSAVIRLENRGAEDLNTVGFEVEVSPELYPRESSGWFYATFHLQNIDTSDGRDVLLLQTNGWGKVVGVNMGIWNLSRDPLGYLEGDERIYLDGSRTPQIYGTGTEDFFNGGWYFNNGTFSLPQHGHPASKHEWNSAWGTPPYITNNFTSAYRFFLGDSIPFYKDVKFGMEHGYNNSQKGIYSTVTYFYRHPERVGLTPVLAMSMELQNGILTTNEWAFEGDDDLVSRTLTGKTEVTESQFTVSFCTTNAGLLLRRSMDLVPGRQRAEVFINGFSAGSWLTSDCNFSNESIRWAEADFLVPATQTAGRTSVTVRIESAASNWSEYAWQAFAIEPLFPSDDYDEDDLPDEWEVRYFTNIASGIAESDTDADQMSAHAEYIAGTNPQRADSSLTLRYESGSVVFPSISNRTYSILFCRNLITGNWEVAQAGLTGTSAQIYYDLQQDAPDYGYYRIDVSKP